MQDEDVYTERNHQELIECIQKDIKARERKLELILERKPEEGPAIVEGLRAGKTITEAYRVAMIHINDYISKFEDRFAKRVELHWYKYINQEFNAIKNSFHKKSQEQFIALNSRKKSFSVRDLSVIIEETLKTIAQKFFDEGDFIRIFGLVDFNQSVLRLLAASDRDGSMKLKNLIFNTSKIPESIIRKGQNISNKDDADGKYLKDGFEFTIGKRKPDIRKDDIIRYYPTLSSKVTFIIWKRYNSDNSELDQFRNLKNALLDFYTSIAATYASLWGSETDKRLEDTIRIARHESFQVITRIQDTLQSNFTDSDKLERIIRNNTFSKKVDDIFIYLKLMRFTMDKGAFLFRRDDIKLAPLDLYQIFNKSLSYNFV